jgi:rhamnose transport system substrate-binding protein
MAIRNKAFAALALTSLLGVAACGDTKESTEKEAASTPAATTEGGAAAGGGEIKEGLKIAFLPKQINNPYFTISDKGGEDAVNAVKGEFKRVGPSDTAASSQVSYINTLTTQKQDAIVISANDANAVVPALQKAKAAGIKVVTYDSDTAPEGRDLFINQAASEDLGRSQVQLLAKQIGPEGGEIAILSATPNATNQNAWIEVMKTELAKPENAKLKLVKTAYGNDDDQKSFQEAQGLLQSYPNLKVIVSPTTVGIAAASRYVSSSNYKGKVAITGLGLPNQMREYVKDGTVKKFALWNPADIGYLAAFAGAAMASGQITGAQGEKFKAGKLGEYTIGADGEIVLGPPTEFTKENIDQFNF